MDINNIPTNPCNVIINDTDSALVMAECGSGRGDGFIVEIYNEYGNRKGAQFLTRTQLEMVVARGQELLASDWATGPNAAK